MTEYIEQGPRMSQAVVHGETIYLAGQVGVPGESVAEQTRTILSNIEILLAKAGGDKRNLLMVSIWLADIESDFGTVNGIWDAWMADCPTPARATVQAKLATPYYKVEIAVIAAKI